MDHLDLDSLKKLDADSPAYSKAISEMGNLITSAVGSVREISHDLSPHVIESNDLCNALEILIGKCKALTKINIVFISIESYYFVKCFEKTKRYEKLKIKSY